MGGVLPAAERVMAERDFHSLRAQALAALAEATWAVNSAPDVESALAHLTAAQARHTYGPIDLDILMCFAHVATAVYMAQGGPEFLRLT